jgi:hypothetical protein
MGLSSSQHNMEMNPDFPVNVVNWTRVLKDTYYNTKNILIRGAAAQLGPRSPILSFLDHTVRRTKQLGLLWTSEQPVTEDSTTQKANIHVLRGTRTHIPPKKELLTHALDHTATGIHLKICYAKHIPCAYNKRTGQHFMLHGLKNTMFQEKKEVQAFIHNYININQYIFKTSGFVILNT